jgi:hypothetical protein
MARGSVSRVETDESEERKDSGGLQGRRKKSDESLRDGRRFACHFYKKDSVRYSAQNCSSRGLKYRVCMGPGSIELRHLKHDSLNIPKDYS